MTKRISILIVLLASLMLCVSAEIFRVRCPKCQVTQQLTPVRVTEIGSVRTNGGFNVERRLDFKCDQRKCRNAFESHDWIFKKEVIAIPVDLPPLPPTTTTKTASRALLASTEAVAESGIPSTTNKTVAFVIAQDGPWQLQVSSNLTDWVTTSEFSVVLQDGNPTGMTAARLIPSQQSLWVSNVTATGESSFAKPVTVMNAELEQRSYSAVVGPVNYAINRGGNAPENGGGAAYVVDAYSFANEPGDWYCPVQGFATGVDPGSAVGISGVGAFNTSGSTNIGAAGVALVGTGIRGIGVVARTLTIDRVNQGIWVAKTNVSLRVDSSSSGWLFFATTDNTNAVAKMERNGDFYTRGRVFTNWNGQ